ncbi:hypothetical protein EV561_12618 [Rhizobium sp. BK376]|nr:hypothetical protein EV561_12618 [Rhizobium sp. BK376]
MQSVAYVALCNDECMVRICFFKPNFVAATFQRGFYSREMGQMKLSLLSYAIFYYPEKRIRTTGRDISVSFIATSLNVKE